jgi:hypothetical protein
MFNKQIAVIPQDPQRLVPTPGGYPNPQMLKSLIYNGEVFACVPYVPPPTL